MRYPLPLAKMLATHARHESGRIPHGHSRIYYLPVETSLPVFRSQRTVRTARCCSPWQLGHTRLFVSVCVGDRSRKRLTTARGSTSWPSWHRAHEESMDSTGTKGTILIVTARCPV